MNTDMDSCLVQTTKRYFIAKNMQKLIEKMQAHYKDGKITEEEVRKKIQKLEELIEVATQTIIKHGEEIEEKTKQKK